MTQDSARPEDFSSGVTVLFATQVAGAAIGIVNGLILAGLLGPTLKGEYYVLVLIPTTAMVLIQFGLPHAFGFYAAKGGVDGMVRQSLVLTLLFGVAALAVIMVLLPSLESVSSDTVGINPALLALVALPLLLNATFATGIVIGRQAVRWYAVVNVGTSLVTTILLLAVLGWLGPSVVGAIAIFLVAKLVQSAGFTLGAWRVAKSVPARTRTAYRELFRYGLRFYPSSIMGFFSARADVFLIAWMVPNAAAPLGLYSLAVGLAEMVFFFPNAVASMFFPQVAASAKEDADRRVADVSRVTLLVAGVVAILLVPAAMLLTWTLLPDFKASLAPLFLLLPGVVALSVAKVAGGYVTGIGRPGVNSAISIAALALNVALNIALIPTYGIVGAAAASLASYAFNAVALTAYSSRASGASFRSFWIIGPRDVRFTLVTGLALLGRLRASLHPLRGDGA